MNRPILAAALLLALAGPSTSRADAAADEAERKRLEEQIARELETAASQPAAPAAAPAPAAQPAGQGSQGGAAPWARVLLLPDISAIGSFAAVWDSYEAGTLSPRSGTTGPAEKPAFVFQELELALQAVVDPYVRADVFTSFTPDGVSVEEAYVTTLSLPGAFQVRGGKLYSPFGRINTTHPHTWEFLDAPLAHDRLVGNEKLGGPGLDVSWLSPLPWFAELHLAAQSTAPFPGEAERLTATARLSQFFSLSDALTLGVGLSAARRDQPGPGAFADLASADLFAKYRPIAGRAYVTLQAEGYRRRLVGGLAADPGAGWGAFAQLFWRQDAWFGYGLRWDRAPAVGSAPPAAFSGAEQRWSAVADWFVTEFQRIGLQGSWDRRPGSADGWEVLLHAEFVIGAHGAHPF